MFSPRTRPARAARSLAGLAVLSALLPAALGACGGAAGELPVMSGYRSVGELLDPARPPEVRAERADDPVRVVGRSSAIDATPRPFLHLAPPAEVRYELPGTETRDGATELAFRFGLDYDAASARAAEAGGRVVFEVEPEGRPAFELALELSGGARAGDRERVRGNIALEDARAVFLRTRFEGRGEPPTAGFDELELVVPRTTRRTRASAERPNLLVFEAPRAPRLEADPRLAALAARGALFERVSGGAAEPLGWLRLDFAGAGAGTLPGWLMEHGVTTGGFWTGGSAAVAPELARDFELRWEGRPAPGGLLAAKIGAALERYGEYRFAFHVHLAETDAPEMSAAADTIGATLARLAELGLEDTTIVAVLGVAPGGLQGSAPSDSGGFLFLAGPGASATWPAGARFAEPVPAASLAPTLLGWMGGETQPGATLPELAPSPGRGR